MKILFLFLSAVVLGAVAVQASTTPNEWRDGVLVTGANPTALEVMVSTTFPQVANAEEYKKIMTDKAYIQLKAIEIDIQLQAYQDLKARYPSLPLNGKITKLSAQLDLLFSIFTSLP